MNSESKEILRNYIHGNLTSLVGICKIEIVISNSFARINSGNLKITTKKGFCDTWNKELELADSAY